MRRSRISGCLAVALLLVSGSAAVAGADPETARVVGHITKPNGTPAAGAQVSGLNSQTGQFMFSTRTDATGSYASGTLAPGTYKIQIIDRFFNTQWARQKRSFVEAESFTVATGADTVVHDVLLVAVPVGAMAVTASDKATGAPINHFCANAFGRFARSGCTDTGTLTLDDLPPGDYQVGTFGNQHYFNGSTRAEVAVDQATTVHFVLEPAALITTTVQDAVTHAPVANACLHAVDNLGGFSVDTGWCSGPDGRVTIAFLRTGSYRLHVSAKDGVHGDQWVGRHGGTGIELFAKVVTATAGQTVTVPPIGLDGAGSISGTVTDQATGEPVRGVCAFTHAGATTGGPDSGPYCTKADGKYTINGVGPYVWPVHFIDTIGTHAWQWSGDRPTQLTARLLTVQVGQTTPLDAHLGVTATVSGRITGADGQPLPVAAVQAFNALTGDPVANYAIADEQGNYRLAGIAGPQFLRVQVVNFDEDREEVWYRDAASFERATPVLVRSGAAVTGIDVVVPAR